jgi:hypothetical protein
MGYFIFTRDLHLGKGASNALGKIADLCNKNLVVNDLKSNICKIYNHIAPPSDI